MARSKAKSKDDATPLVLDVLRAVHAKTKHRKQPYYTSADDRGVQATDDKITPAILLAELEGWLRLRGRPGHSLVITDGRLRQIGR